MIITIARKPISEKNVALNVLEHGTGGLNIDGCRIGVLGKGRWPSNFSLQHLEGCQLEGTRSMKPQEGHRVNPVKKQSDGKAVFNHKPPGYQKVSYTNSDGKEVVEKWVCGEGCLVGVFVNARFFKQIKL
jgi:hypothetical protein